MGDEPEDSPKRSWNRVAPLSVGVILLLLSVLSLLPVHLKREIGFDRSRTTHMASHFAGFAVLAFGLRLAMRRNHAWLALGAAAMVGITLEMLEHIVYGAPLEMHDIALDIAAAFVGWMLAILMAGSAWAAPRGNG